MENSRPWLRSLASAHLLLAKSESGCTVGSVPGKVVLSLPPSQLPQLGPEAALRRAMGRAAVAMCFLFVAENSIFDFPVPANLPVSESREGLKCSPNFNRMLWMGSPFPTLGSLSGAGHSSTSCRVSLVVSESPDFIWESFFFLTGTWRTEWDSFYPWSLFWLLRPTLEW